MGRRQSSFTELVDRALNIPWQVSSGLALFGAPAASVTAVSLLSWRQFESVVGDSFRQRGFDVSERGAEGVIADRAVDLVLSRTNERYLVQCKQWRAQPIGISAIRGLYGAISADGASGGYVVTTGTFTGEARDFARDRHIELIDEKNLDEFLHRQPGMVSRSRSP
jgi:restriction system protein